MPPSRAKPSSEVLRGPHPRRLLILNFKMLCTGVCHTDLHAAFEDWSVKRTEAHAPAIVTHGTEAISHSCRATPSVGAPPSSARKTPTPGQNEGLAKTTERVSVHAPSMFYEATITFASHFLTKLTLQALVVETFACTITILSRLQGWTTENPQLAC